jgi:hypothetical protein
LPIGWFSEILEELNSMYELCGSQKIHERVKELSVLS